MSPCVRAALTVFVLGFSPASSMEAPQEDAKDVLAAHLRLQGYPCVEPQSAVRLPRLSRPGEAVWLVKCTNASYRLRLIPDMAAIVEPVGKR